MIQKMYTRSLAALAIVFVVTQTSVAGVSPQTTRMTYQGRLEFDGTPAGETYDFQCKLFDAPVGGTQLGLTTPGSIEANPAGEFTMTIDFGPAVYEGSERWLELGVRLAGTGPYSTMSPRQQIRTVPYAAFALAGNEGPPGPPGSPGSDALWTVNGTTMYYTNGNVGIGSAFPQGRLHVGGGNIVLEAEGFDPYIQLHSDGLADSTVMRLKSLDAVGFAVTNGQDITRLLVKDTGEVGIGTLAPDSQLHVETVGPQAIHGETHFINGTAVFGEATGIGGSATGVHGISSGIAGRGVVGIADLTSGPNYGVYGQSDSAAGYDFYAAGAGVNYGASSSIRWKSRIESIDQPLDMIAQLRGVFFDWDDQHGGHHDIGMIAEDVGEVLPEIVQYEANGIDASGMDYSKLTPLLVEGVNALRDEKDMDIATLRRELDTVRLENAALRARLTLLEDNMKQLISIGKE